MPPVDAFEGLRPLLFSIAYRMLGSVAGAEDVLQEAYLRFDAALRSGAAIESARAYLSAIVTRLAIDELRSARTRREEYVGTWLPEPVLTDDVDPIVAAPPAADPAAFAESAETLSMAFLLVLDRLAPLERAVFLLHDVFGYRFGEIAGIVDRSEVNCRQIAARARRRVRDEKPRLDVDRRERDELGRRFFAAMADGDVNGLLELLAPDVVVHGDGGGKAPQWTRAVVGADRVARLLAGVGRQMRELDLRVEPRQVNGQPGALIRDAAGRITNVFSVDVVDGSVATVRSVINPDKLRHLGPLADVRRLAERLGRRS